MTEALPDPLVPAEVDLRDFGFMPLDVRTLLTSSLWIKAKKDPRVAHAAVSLWCEAWHQVPAASLPDDDEVLADLARCDEKEWKRIRGRALAHFLKCSDGRLYHRTVAAKALEAWERKQELQEKSGNTLSRQQRWRHRLKETAERLRMLGVRVPRNASLQTLETILRDAEARAASTSASTSASTQSVSAVDALDTAVTALTGTETGTETGNTALASGNARALAPEVEVCRRLKAEVGMPDVNPSNQQLRELVQRGVGVDVIVDCAIEKRSVKGGPPGFAYVLATVHGRLEQAPEAGGRQSGRRGSSRLDRQAETIRQLTTSDPGREVVDG